MVSTTLPNHYEMLGLTSEASDDEIARAFAQQMSLFKAWPMAAAAQMSIAYETLRNPAKRRAYDDSLGFRPPEPLHSPTAVQGHMHYIPSAPGKALERAAETRQPAPPAKPRPRAAPAAEPRTASFIAASLREPELPPRAEPEAPAMVEARITEDFALYRAQPAWVREAEDQPVSWKRAGIVAGALVGIVGLAGAWAGIEAGNDAEQEQVTVALPNAKPLPGTAAPSTVQTSRPSFVTEAQPKPRARPAVATRTVERSPIPKPTVLAQELSDTIPSEPSPTEASATEPGSADGPAISVPANLPLSNATIARTIGRIGYACGEVASTSAVEGGVPGVFKVTCTSGHSYRATPIRGRYRFRQLH